MFPIEAFQATLQKLTKILRKHDIAFHLTGGVTSIAYGEPRMTQDVDVVVRNEQISGCLRNFVQTLDLSDFIFDEQAIRLAVKEQKMFQLLDSVESLKLDIYPRELIVGELQRSKTIELFDGDFYPIASRTDTAIAKLLWIDQGSHKSRRDLRHLYCSASPAEKEEIQRMAAQKALAELLDTVLVETDEVDL